MRCAIGACRIFPFSFCGRVYHKTSFNNTGPSEAESVPTPHFEKSTLAHAAIEEFGDHLFWDELIRRLAVRDMSREVGGMDHLYALGDEDRQAVEGPLRPRYIQEFSKNGLANIVVVGGFAGRGSTPATSD